MHHPTDPSLSADKQSGTSRRMFLRNSSLLVAGGAIAASQVQVAQGAHAFGSDTIKVGLVGCGGRGTQAVQQAMNTSGGEVKLFAMADAFTDRLTGSLRGINSQHPTKVDVPKDRQFVGFDAYKDLLQTDCDIIFLATPPGFRPLHFAAAVAAGKHVFSEKPVAVDAAGIRKFLAANEEAKKKNLAVAIGLQRRHERKYMATVKAIQDGDIGDIVLARAFEIESNGLIRRFFLSRHFSSDFNLFGYDTSYFNSLATAFLDNSFGNHTGNFLDNCFCDDFWLTSY
jgi:predicted dehydrogenase